MNVELEFYNDNWARDPNGLNFRGVHWVELALGPGGASQVINDMWLRVVSGWGNAEYTAWFDERDGKGVSNTGKRFTGASDWSAVPSKCRMVRIEGRRDNAHTLVNVGLIPLGK